MRKLIIFSTMIFICQVTMAQTKTFSGAWFDINYPSNFIAKGSLKSSTSDGFESAIFKSPDNLVEFYIFSPQWNGEATDIVLKTKEKLSSLKSEIKGDIETKWWTINHSDGSYSRSYQQKYNQSQNTKLIIGIKYKNSSALEKYKKEYASFKNSLKQYAD
ncbi:MAG: hypothetical protein FJX80_13910 [Bacteroidetes bacterium]|nr:hypothetical protein [Bacteroidota bacterium]